MNTVSTNKMQRKQPKQPKKLFSRSPMAPSVQRLYDRSKRLEETWCFGNYLIVKSGNALQYVKRDGKQHFSVDEQGP